MEGGASWSKRNTQSAKSYVVHKWRLSCCCFFIFFLSSEKATKSGRASSSWVTAMCRQWASQPSLSSATDYVLSTTATAIYLLSGSRRKSLIFSKDRIDAAIVAGCVSHTWQLDWKRTIEHCRAKCICTKVYFTLWLFRSLLLIRVGRAGKLWHFPFKRTIMLLRHWLMGDWFANVLSGPTDVFAFW